MADVTKIDVVSMLEPNGEPEDVENLKRISKLFYGSKNGDLIEPLDEDVVASLKTVIDAYGVIPIIANVLTNGAGGGVSYDVLITGKTASFIDNTTSSAATVTNVSVTALQDIDTLLAKMASYKTLSLAGAIAYTDSTYGDMNIPVTIRYAAVEPNAAVKALLPQLDIGDDDAILLEFTCANNTTAYRGTYIIYGATDGTVKSLSMT